MDCILTRQDALPKFNPLEDAVMEDIAPSVWDGPHVGKRLSEAMRRLRMLPMRAIAGYSSAWPAYVYEWEGLLAQQEQTELEKTQRMQKWARLLPSYSDVTRMEIAIYWPAHFLAQAEHLIRAVNLVAIGHSMERDPNGSRASAAATPTHGASVTTRDARSSRAAYMPTCCRSSDGRGLAHSWVLQQAAEQR
ncbi:hypothetical protein CV770_31800 [Bradyrhizobium sp. AC87j1]|uniref:hypothetical protein n=1 Tax=Bradyrhizobium sp. AC87j1 TaxID=2055894 RepID=UPI000CEC5327|nr:hypothetical protein [Bradyrhizobium sp. AC87j1]PPQ15418.1 hypothetical protein CV770_31800 [Bradyrhizobium sp. AC87j1]